MHLPFKKFCDGSKTLARDLGHSRGWLIRRWLKLRQVDIEIDWDPFQWYTASNTQQLFIKGKSLNLLRETLTSCMNVVCTTIKKERNFVNER